MWNSILADIVVGLHLAYVSYVLVGQVLIWVGWALRWQWVRNLWFRVTHLAMVSVVAIEAVFGITCPMTEWEAALTESVQERSFIGTLLSDILFIDLPDTHPIFMISYVGVGVLVLATFVFLPPRVEGYRKTTVAAIILGLIGAIFLLFISPIWIGLALVALATLCWAVGANAEYPPPPKVLEGPS